MATADVLPVLALARTRRRGTARGIAWKMMSDAARVALPGWFAAASTASLASQRARAAHAR